MPDLTPALWIYGVGLLVGAVVDYRTGRLPNWLTFSMTAVGIAIWSTQGDPLVALAGIGVALAIHFPLFALNVVRAGDAKLVMGASALVGWQESLELTAWYAIIYIPVGLLQLVAKRRLANLGKVARSLVEQQGDEPPPELTTLRTGPVIALAGLVAASTNMFFG